VSTVRGDASEFYDLANDLSQVDAKTVPLARAAMLAAGEVVAKAWRNNILSESAASTSIPHYPESIDAELTFSIRAITVEVGPNKAKKQGSLGHLIELGTETSPPHLHGLRAMTDNEANVERALDQGLNSLFG
jgi:hypothetical protein